MTRVEAEIRKILSQINTQVVFFPPPKKLSNTNFVFFLHSSFYQKINKHKIEKLNRDSNDQRNGWNYFLFREL